MCFVWDKPLNGFTHSVDLLYSIMILFHVTRMQTVIFVFVWTELSLSLVCIEHREVKIDVHPFISIKNRFYLIISSVRPDFICYCHASMERSLYEKWCFNLTAWRFFVIFCAYMIFWKNWRIDSINLSSVFRRYSYTSNRLKKNIR